MSSRPRKRLRNYRRRRPRPHPRRCPMRRCQIRRVQPPASSTTPNYRIRPGVFCALPRPGHRLGSPRQRIRRTASATIST
ncbi:MAG: hypothetical protein F4Z28_01180 [Gammaproteobacteria bacterium]|nr:hypothetical protein [Gammaproteobacteria bacterium]